MVPAINNAFIKQVMTMKEWFCFLDRSSINKISAILMFTDIELIAFSIYKYILLVLEQNQDSSHIFQQKIQQI